MESIAGMQSGLNQSNAISGQDGALFSSIAQLNNNNTTAFNQKMRDEKTTDHGIENDNLNKMIAYAGGVGEKVNELKDFVKDGKDIADLRSYKAVAGAGPGLAKAGNILASGVKSVGSSGFKAGSIIPDSPSIDLTTQNIADRTGGAGDDQTTTINDGDEWMDLDEHPDHFDTPADDGAEDFVSTTEDTAGDTVEGVEGAGTTAEQGAEDFVSTTISTAGKTAKVGEEAGADALTTIGKMGKFAGGVAKVGGAVFSAGMLGDDIYNQVKDKSFFAGDNTGDKIGNFLNEAGSIADLGGIATADPLLVMAGVGIGAIGSVVSDISDLFGHHKKEGGDAGNKPTDIVAPASQNIAGVGNIARTNLSTLRTVQAGAS